MCATFKKTNNMEDGAETIQSDVHLAIWNGFKPVIFLGQWLGVFGQNVLQLRRQKLNKM